MGDTTRSLRIGDPAPEFALKGTDGQEFKLGEARGKNVLLAFFPAAFSSVCSAQMPRIQEEKADLGEDTLVLGVSVDGIAALTAFAKQTGIDFPLLSDFYPHGEVAEKYGVLHKTGVAERAVVGIDKEGVVRYIDVSPFVEIPELASCASALRG